MTDLLWALLGLAAFLALAVLVLDRVLRGVMPIAAWLLPDDVCGPNGWLVDTRDGRGVFDRRAG